MLITVVRSVVLAQTTASSSAEGVVKVTGFADALDDTPARKRRPTRQVRATPPMQSSVSACNLPGDEMPLLIELVVDLGVN
jgi:hypothetical protein